MRNRPTLAQLPREGQPVTEFMRLMFGLFKSRGDKRRTAPTAKDEPVTPKPRVREDRSRIYAVTDSRAAAETAKAGFIAALKR